MPEIIAENFTLDILFAMLCITLNGFFVIAEFSLVKIRSSRVQQLVEAGDIRAPRVSKLLEDIEGNLAATQFGITLTSLGLGFVGEPAFARMVQGMLPTSLFGQTLIIHTLAIVISFALITFFQIVLGELVPRALAIRYAEGIALSMAPVFVFVRRTFAPFLFVLDRSAKFILRTLGVRTGTRLNEKLTEDELRLVLVESIGKGAIADSKIDLIDNVFDFSRRTAKHVMIARDAIVSLNLTTLIEDNLAKAKQSNHTRYPLCEGTIDQVVGLVNFKDVLWQSESSREHMDLRRIRREILFVPENKPLTKLLKDFQRNKIHMAIVIDEFGLTVGLVTLEDVLEELVGEIQDEYDQEVSRIQLMRDGSYLIEGSTLIDEVEEKLGIRIEKQDNTTIGGAVLSNLGRLPKIGDVADIAEFTFIVKALKGRRIYTLQAIQKARPAVKI
jgi:CBS domain containing-hemolysin-like protein